MQPAPAVLMVSLVLAAAVPAWAQAPEAQPPAPPPAKSKKPLDLRLDPVDQGRPRVSFGARDGEEKKGTGGLPELGGSPAPERSFAAPSGLSAPYPKDSQPGH